MPRVNPEILSWARKTAGFSLSDAVEKLGINDARGIVAVDRLAAIESGAKEPSRPLCWQPSPIEKIRARHGRRRGDFGRSTQAHSGLQCPELAQLRPQIVPWSTLCRADWVCNDPVLTSA
jgi:hypothetical protein